MDPFPFPRQGGSPYDDFDGFDDSPYDYRGGGGPWAPDELERLTHLVLVDGRLVDVWSEPVTGTRWQSHADRFDRERRPEIVQVEPPEPPRPAYDEVLEWLALVVGGRDVLEHLGQEPLRSNGIQPPTTDLDIRSRHRLESATEQLARAADQFPDGEIGVALRRALLTVWEIEPEVILRAKSAAHTVAGVCWAVGKANGAFGPQGPLTQGGLRESLGLPCPLSAAGAPVRRALQGFLTVPTRCPAEAPDLLPLGRVVLLTSSTRRMLARLRDRAVEAKRIHEGAEVLP